ncbi:hypothetical protein ACHRV5_11085 [Flavobacterium sp. FlaQc-52]|uniref:hypothetical protein n=1 Tax=Flavobacterium sp. FlaQc-52 TaxID=3374185 RepID=UPI003757BA39
MKKIVLLLFLTAFTTENLQAQASQQKVLLQQIAALKMYIGYAQKGYSVARKGLKAIGDFKRGEFNLHTDYFTSLKSVNPRVRHYVRIGEIIALQVKIMKSYSRIYEQLHQGDLFHGDEVDYIRRVFERLIENCDQKMDDMLMIVTDAQLEMKDDERIRRIDVIYQGMQENAAFCEGFSKQTRLLALSRTKEVREVKTSRSLNGFKTVLP